ncbi:MAG: type II toxin-antitoxin system YhaV family toxin, partial [Beijerinckiaceae bacterium]|nr:type II toxin-antitoxin system YhaV family toxin [Beijerinckiaceae bacterium]
GAKTDAYRVFKGMLDKGNPPDDWKDLLAAASTEPVVARLEGAKPR